MAANLELLAHGGTAILATWLGLIVLSRGRRQPGARVFAAISALLVTWSLAIVVQRLGTQPVDQVFKAMETAAAYLLPAVVLHITLSLTTERRWTGTQRANVAVAYAVSGVAALWVLVFPGQRLAVTPPHLELPGIGGETLGWTWIVARVLIMASAVFWIAAAMRHARGDRARLRQLRLTLATVAVAVMGGVLGILPATASAMPWLSVSLLAVAVVLAAYGVFGQGVFLTPEAAGYAFRSTAVVGLGVALYVVALMAIDSLARSALGIDLPIVATLALVVTIALFDPIAEWARRTVRGRSSREVAYDRLLRALGEDVLTAQRPEAVVVPALSRLSRTFQLLGAQVETPDGDVVARHGKPVANSPIALRIPLDSGSDAPGWAAFGPKRSLLPFTPDETDLLSQGAAYLSASLRLAELHEVQAEALESLSAQRLAVEERGTVLQEAIVRAEHTEPGIRVFALGPLRVELDGVPIRSWGGEKAGTRQAEALFAFLFDRGERGVAKDEITELIWPDVDLRRADVAFHRTLSGLRTTLEPGRRPANRGDVITFRNDRYRLAPGLVTWSDVRAFDEAMAATSSADPDEALRQMERARSLYRGDYLDDCPFYGDSAQAEERRGELRGRYVDLLLALGESYERRGDRPLAAAMFRQARGAWGDELPRADAGLARLAAPP